MKFNRAAKAPAGREFTRNVLLLHPYQCAFVTFRDVFSSVTDNHVNETAFSVTRYIKCDVISLS